MSEENLARKLWNQGAREAAIPETVVGHLPLLLSAVGALGVAPFAIMRWMNGDWLIAVIDTVIVFGLVILGTYVYRTRNVRAASLAIAMLGVGGTLITVYVRGPLQVFWAFPAVMAVFYLLRPREAIALTLVMTAGLLPELVESLNLFRASTVVITILLTSAFAYAFSEINGRQRILLVEMATKDPLTGAGNRRALESKLSDLVAASDRSGSPASLILIDVDHFKTVNDVHGHAVGDQILQSVTQIMNLRIRMSDSLYRIGGEEFVVVVDGQNLERAKHLGEQLRTLVEVNELVPGSNVTISLGVAELEPGETFSKWLCRADDALYRAKRAGRNTLRSAD